LKAERRLDGQGVGVHAVFSAHVLRAGLTAFFVSAVQGRTARRRVCAQRARASSSKLKQPFGLRAASASGSRAPTLPSPRRWSRCRDGGEDVTRVNQRRWQNVTTVTQSDPNATMLRAPDWSETRLDVETPSDGNGNYRRPSRFDAVFYTTCEPLGHDPVNGRRCLHPAEPRQLPRRRRESAHDRTSARQRTRPRILDRSAVQPATCNSQSGQGGGGGRAGGHRRTSRPRDRRPPAEGPGVADGVTRGRCSSRRDTIRTDHTDAEQWRSTALAGARCWYKLIQRARAFPPAPFAKASGSIDPSVGPPRPQLTGPVGADPVVGVHQ
jgi:hypothetical protein